MARFRFGVGGCESRVADCALQVPCQPPSKNLRWSSKTHKLDPYHGRVVEDSTTRLDA